MKKFLYGVSCSAFQIEGDDGKQGRGKSVWDEFCEREDYNGENAKKACDHYNHMEEDIDLLKELGVDCYRFSTSWPRILPDGIGRINQKGIDFYDRLIDRLLKNGIEPCLTAYHWDMPEALNKKGGLKNDDFPKWFEEYAALLSKYYGDRVRLYIPANEPINCVHSSYYSGAFAPGERLNKRQTLDVVHNFLLAHSKAAEVFHQANKNNVVSSCMSTFEEYPVCDTPKCYEAAKRVFFHKENRTDSIDLYLDPLYLGKYPYWVEQLYPDFAEKTEKDMKFICGKLDYLGYNNYGAIPIDENGNEVAYSADHPRGAQGHAIDHNSMYYNIKFLTERYRVPILITENGYSIESSALEKDVHDKERADYILDSNKVVDRLLSEGIDLKGYFVWSFTDHFEWNYGLTKRLGLVYIDYNNMNRIPKDSFYVYKNYIENKRK